MKKFTFVALIFLGLTAQKCERSAVYEIDLRITKTATYCGGAAPPEFLLKELRTPTPYTGASLYVFDSNSSCLDSLTNITADSTYKLVLPLGTYNLHLVNELTLNVGKNDREQCLHDWRERSMGQLVVQNDSAQTVNLHLDCNPCYPPPP